MFARIIKETLTQLALSNCTKQEGEEEGQVCGRVQHVFALKCTVLIKKGGGGGRYITHVYADLLLHLRWTR